MPWPAARDIPDRIAQQPLGVAADRHAAGVHLECGLWKPAVQKVERLAELRVNHRLTSARECDRMYVVGDLIGDGADRTHIEHRGLETAGYAESAGHRPQYAYMYHCHLLFHEGRGMTGQFVVVERGHAVGQINHHDHHHGGHG
jgi:Multicopper oxidase